MCLMNDIKVRQVLKCLPLYSYTIPIFRFIFVFPIIFLISSSLCLSTTLSFIFLYFFFSLYTTQDYFFNLREQHRGRTHLFFLQKLKKKKQQKLIDVNRKNMSNRKGLRNFKNIFLFCTSTLILFFFPFPDSLCVLLFPPAGMRSPKPFVSVRQLRNHIEVNSQDRKHSPIYLLNMLGFRSNIQQIQVLTL